MKFLRAYWNCNYGYISSDLPSKYGNADDLNAELRRMFRVAEDIVLFIHQKKLSNPGEFAKNTFTPHFDSVCLKDIAKDLEREMSKQT